MRLSLSTLLVATAVFGLLLAAVAWPNQFWAEIFFSATIACLAASTLAAIAWRAPHRWFCLGFALAGLAYLILAIPLGDQTRPLLVTHRLLVEIDSRTEVSKPKQLLDGTTAHWTSDGRIEVARPFGYQYFSPADAAKLGYLQLAYASPGAAPTSRNFYNNGHLAWTWILATAGGALTLWLHSRKAALE
jgi:hypothetical protein